MIDLSFQIAGTEAINNRLAGFIRRVSDFRPAFERIHQSFLEMEAEQFETEGQGKWPAWSSTYEWFRESRGASGSKLLQWGSGLMNSLTSGAAPGHISEIGPHEAKFGTDLSTQDDHPSRVGDNKHSYGLGLAHHKGYTAKYPYGNKSASPKKVPARPLIELNDAYRQKWLKIIQEWVMQSSSGFPEHFS